jgi:hypothetical protein
MAAARRFTALSLKQFLAIAASFIAIYFVSTHHKALQDWFSPPKATVATVANGKPVVKTS